MSVLGKAPDHVIARERGLSTTTIRRLRVKKGIPAYKENPIDWTKIDPDLFAKTCRDLAKEHGVSAMAISNRRKLKERV